MIERTGWGALALGLLLAAAAPAEAAVVTLPPGLAPGAQYRLAFVTSTTRDATATDIAVYDAFVTTAASAVPELVALNTTWRAIGSTTTVDARDHTATNPTTNGAGVPIFRLDGVKIADTNADLWDGSLDAVLGIDERGQPATSTNRAVWTGTAPNGVKGVPISDGDGPLGTGGTFGPRLGLADTTSSAWIGAGATGGASSLRSLYGLSDPLVAPVPAPAALPLFASALAGLAALGRRRRKG